MQTCVPNDDQTANFAAWRVLALGRMPYMASYLFGIRVLNAPGLGTFAVDAHFRMYIDFDAVTGWGHENCAQVLLHEISHLFGEHSDEAEMWGLTANDQRRTWNAACDASINDDLVDAGCEFIEEIGVTPGKFDAEPYQTAKHYYDVLAAQAQQDQGDEGSGEKPDDATGDSQGQPGECGAPSDQNSESGGTPNGTGSDDDQQDSGFAGCGSGSGGLSAPCELTEGDAGPQESAPAASAAEKQRVAISTAQAIKDHMTLKGIGSVPGGILERANIILTPSKTPWQRIVRSAVRRVVRQQAGHDRSDTMRRDRRRHSITIGDGKKVVMPGRCSPKIKVAVVRDTSGSMSAKDLEAVSCEIMGVARSLRIKGADLLILDVDTEVAATRKYDGAKSLMDVAGRGGTDMAAGITAALDHRPDVIIVLTDGYTPWGEQPPVPVLACIVRPAPDNQYTTGWFSQETPGWLTTITIVVD